MDVAELELRVGRDARRASSAASARDEAGNAQPDEADWNVGGYANNGIQRVAVRVV